MRKQFDQALEEDRLRTMPNSFLPPAPLHKPGMVMLMEGASSLELFHQIYEGVMILGDAMNMRHPLTGAGMTVALKDVTILRELLREIPSLVDRAKVQEAVNCLQWKRKLSHSFVINVLAQALYALFSANEGQY